MGCHGAVACLMCAHAPHILSCVIIHDLVLFIAHARSGCKRSDIVVWFVSIMRKMYAFVCYWCVVRFIVHLCSSFEFLV